MLWPRTLHARLTFAYSIAFVAGLVAFAIISYSLLDGALNAIVDLRLRTAEASVAALLERDPPMDHATRERIGLLIGTSTSGAVFSANGRAIYSSVLALPPATRANLLRAGPQVQISSVQIDGLSRLATARILTHDGRPAYIAIWRELGAVSELERVVALIFTGLVIAIGALGVFAGHTIARRGLVPLRAVAELASEIEARDLSKRLGVHDDDSELGRLCQTFDRMLERLEAAFERQRRFAADASHHLRAPLAVIRVAAAFALRRERDAAAYQRVLASIERASERLEAIIEQLLTAARADAGHVKIERIELTGLVRGVLDDVQPLAESRAVNLSAQLQSPAFFNADRNGIVHAVLALLDNAIKFSPAASHVTVSAGSERGVVRLAVRDHGPGFTERGLNQATARFWRDDDRTVARNGSGLGLAISDAIVRGSGGRLLLSNAADGGAVVVMEFPSA